MNQERINGSHTGAGAKPGYQEAITLTTSTIDRRAASFKRFVIGVVGISLASLLGAAILWSWRPLVGLGLLLPLCGWLYWLDGVLVGRWQRAILAFWKEGALDLSILRTALLAVPAIPSGTLQGMLSSLPKFDVPEHRLPLALRSALAETVAMIFAIEQNRLAGWAAGYALVFIVLLVEVIEPSWHLLWGGGMVFLLLTGLRQGIASIHQRRWKRRLQQLVADGMEIETFISLAEQLDWGCLSGREASCLLSTFKYGATGSSKTNPT